MRAHIFTAGRFAIWLENFIITIPRKLDESKKKFHKI